MVRPQVISFADSVCSASVLCGSVAVLGTLQVITFEESEEVEDDSYLMDLGPRSDFDAAGTQLPEGVWDTPCVPRRFSALCGHPAC